MKGQERLLFNYLTPFKEGRLDEALREAFTIPGYIFMRNRAAKMAMFIWYQRWIQMKLKPWALFLAVISIRNEACKRKT
jgi:hypothetical protein